MDLSVSRIHGFKSIVAVFALTACAGSLQAAVTATPTSVTLSCNTATGPGAAVPVVIKPGTALTGANTLAVTVGSLTGGLVVTAPTVTTLSTTNQAAGITYMVSLAPGCAGVTNNGTPSITFTAGGSPTTVTTTTTLTATSSALVPSPSPVVITCAKNGSTYTPGSAKTVSITSAASGGTPFTVDTVTNPAPNWLVVTPTTGGTASSTASTFTVQAAAGCGTFASGTSNSGTISLLNAPAPAKSVPVTLQIVPPSPLTASPTQPSISYIKGSGNPGHVDVNITTIVSPAPFFSLDTSTLPIWLTVDSTSGTAPKSLRFTSTSVTDTLAPGTYSASVVVKVSGYGDLSVPVSLLVNNKAPRMSVAEGTTRNISWTLGSSLPTPVITAVSTDTPIAYSVASGGTLAPTISAAQQKGLAYSFGTPINVTFNPLIFASATPGSVLTGTVTLTWGTPASTIVVTFNITIQSANATLTGLSPASLPTANAGATFSVVMSGTGFVQSTDPSQKTKVGIVVGGSLIADTNIASTVINPSNIMLTFTVPATADANLPFATGGTVQLGVCNPSGGTCSLSTGTATLAIGSSPIIQAITSASSFLQVNPPSLQTMAPYDMVSIFGTNFCSSNATGCSSSQILSGTPDPVSLRYPTSLSPDAGTHNLTVTFQTHPGATLIATAPLLFATNAQINLLVPAALAGNVGTTVDIVVNYGTNHSLPFSVNITQTNPGVFTVGADGQGDGAILNTSYAVVSSSNPGGMRSTGTDSDIVQFYVTGLGAPTSTGDNSSAGTVGGAVAPTDCVSPATYWATLNSLTNNSFTSIDGTVIQSALLNTHRLVPCFTANPTVTIGGVAATVTYAGFVPDSVAGLYQVNAQLPSASAGPFSPASGPSINAITAPVQLPVVITTNGVNSQTGVTMWVAPRLLVTPPSGGGLAGTVGVAWSSSNNAVAATEGTSPYRYAVTSGLLPSGLTLGATNGLITGTPNANTSGSYSITVTATDSANVPVTGTTTFTLTVAGGLVVVSSGTAPYHTTFGSASPTVTTVAATGGAYPYTYAITSPSSLPLGMSINANSGVVSTTSATPAGTYHVTVTAMDSTSGTPLTGTVTFDIVVALAVTNTVPTAGTNSQLNTALTTVSALGFANSGTVTYALATGTPSWVTINSTTGAVGTTSSAPTTTGLSVTVNAADSTAAPGAASGGAGSVTFTLVIN